MIDVSCSECHHQMSVGEEHAGQTGKCPKCGGAVKVPEVATDSKPVRGVKRVQAIWIFVAFAVGVFCAAIAFSIFKTDQPAQPDTPHEDTSAEFIDGANVNLADEDSRASRTQEFSPPPSQNSKLTAILPRPIQSEEDLQECIEAVAEYDARMKRFVPDLPLTKTQRLSDCLIQFDEDGGGYVKFYPDGIVARLNFRPPGSTADFNLKVPNVDGSVLHITIYDDLMTIKCKDAAGTQEVDYSLLLNHTGRGNPVERLSEWDQVSNPDELERYCVGVLQEYWQMR